MAKTVKIPDNMSPWKAIINGVEYVYPAGTTQEVPDAVADFIERISKVEPEKAPVMPPFAGGADWNAKEGEPGHVLNRTHYEETTTVKGDTLTWDGNTEGKVTAVDGMFVKISDAIVTVEDIKNGYTYGSTWEDGSYHEFEETIYNDAGCAISIIEGIFVSVLSDVAEFDGLVFPEKGMYVCTPYAEEAPLAITIPGYTGFVSKQTVVKTIDPKFLPEALQFGETTVMGDTLTWDGNTEGLVLFNIGKSVYKVSDAVPTMADLENGATIKLSDSLEVTECDVRESMPGLILIDAGSVVVISESVAGTEIGGVMLPEAGTYLYKYVEGDDQYVASITIPGYTGFETTTIKPLDEKYLPILTSPGGKKFKLSVDDSGTLTATEV
jgi:hypothetical protein